jgi:RNA polymerase sigma-70 factor (ECF subfamily)
MDPDQTSRSDGEILERIGRGDPTAVALLYDRYAATLLGVAFRILGERADAEDVVHDAFVLVGERAGYYVAERGSVVTWLVTMTRNLGIDRKRRRDRRGDVDRTILIHEAIMQTGGVGSNPEAHVVESSECSRMRKALSTLPQQQRTTLELSFFSGLSYPEIAEKEKIALGTVKSRAARGLMALRNALEGSGG